jgi:hypothetical protein
MHSRRGGVSNVMSNTAAPRHIAIQHDGLDLDSIIFGIFIQDVP